MHKKILFLLACINPLCAREIRSPLLRDDPGYRLMPLEFIKDEKWAINAWISPFKRTSTDALCNYERDQCCNFKVKCPLSSIIFGKGKFTGSEAFSPQSATPPITTISYGTNRTISCNPLLFSSVLKPCLRFIDRGVMFALQIARRIHDCWSIGVRGSVPYRNFEITYAQCCSNNTSLFGGQTTRNVACTKRETINGVPVTSYAYRLDFLSSLAAGCKPPQNQVPVVDYANSFFINNPITISNQNVTDAISLPINARNPVSVIHNNTKPSGQLALPLAQAQTLPALPADGITSSYRARFVDNTSYVPLGYDPDTQSELWVVPSVGTTDLVPAALVIRDQVEAILTKNGHSSEEFFELCGDCFAPQAKRGVGDTQTELFVRYQPIDELYIEGLVGISFPTGRRIESPNNVFLWPTGNNGHYEYRLGGYVGYQPSTCFMLNISSYYTWVGKREECVLAAYNGATIKNIGGPIVSADITWSYYLGSIDALFMRNCRGGLLGIDVGYELYNKKHDTVCFKQKTAVDCLGNTSALSRCVLEQRTHVISHKVRTTAFFDTSRNENNAENRCTPKWSIFGGYDIVVSCKNIPRERGPHAGIMVMY